MSELAGGVGDLRRGLGVTKEAVLDGLKSARARIASRARTPRTSTRRSERYGRDLTEDARKRASSIR